MPDEIKQVLGFDAGPAIQALQQLDSAMAQLEGRLGNSAQAFTSFNKNAGKTVSALIQISKHGKAAASALGAVVNATNATPQNSAANATAAATAASQLAQQLTAAGATAQSASVRIGNAMARVGVQSNQTANQVHQNVQRMTVSLGLLNRIVFTQTIVRALSQLRNAFRATVSDAVKFQQQIALIQTIDDSGASFEALGNNIRSISDQFNIPLLEVAAGLYQTISNQIGDAAESQKFLAESAAFARATGSDLKNSVDLLSGALKSFNLETEETARVAGVFFKTIDLGRVEANELANSFGRVGPIAAELGLSLEETSAALASITVRGSKTSEALTQVRAITTALLKPSEAMEKTLRGLGFESGESAIKTLGLADTLRALAESTRGSAAQMAALFPNVRGLAGAAALTSDNLQSLASGITEISEAGEDFSKAKFLQATATDAEKVTRELNKLKNALITDLGQAALNFAATFSDAVGGAEKLATSMHLADEALLAVVGTLGVMRAEVALTNAGFLRLGGILGALQALPIAAALGSGIGEIINEKMREARNVELKALEQRNDEALRLVEARLRKERDVENKADEERLQATRRVFQELNKVYLDDVANARSANDAIVENAKSSLEGVVKTREKLVDQLARAQDEARDIARDSGQRVASARERQGDRDFEREFSQVRNLTTQINELFGRANEISDQARRELAAGSMLGDPTKIAEATRLFEKAQQIGERALGLAGQNRFLQNEAFSDLEELTRKQIAAEEQLQAQQAKRQKALEAERAAQQKIVDTIREQSKIVLANTGVFDKDGKQFDPEEQAKRDKARADALRTIAESALNQKDLNASAALGLADFVSRFQSELSQDPIRLQFTVENEIARIQQQLKNAFANFQLGSGVDVAGLEQVLGRSLNTPEDIANGLEEATKKAAELRKAIDDAATLGPAADLIQAEITQIFETLSAGLAKNREALGTDEQKATFEGILATVKQLATDSNITGEEITSLIGRIKQFEASVNAADGYFFKNASLAFDSSVEKVAQVVNKLQELRTLQAQAGAADPALTAQLAQLDAVLIKQPAAQFGGATQAMNAAVGPTQAIAAGWERAAAAAERAARAAAQASAGPANRAFGGMMHLAAGGSARGIDTIPAMLSPGEFVMNARSSRKFYAQLQAMNAGQAPTYRENGGSVTNVGDIHVAVNGGNTATQTIREIGRGLRREIRRGTLDL